MNMRPFGAVLTCLGLAGLTLGGFIYYGWVAVPVGVALGAGYIWERFYKN